MYVVKFSRTGLRWQVRLLEKHWSEEMLSHEASIKTEKTFFLRSSGCRWVNKEIARLLFEQHKLEIIDG